MENRKPTFRLREDHQQLMEKEKLYDVKILKNRSYSANQKDIICLCIQGSMSRCSQIGVWDKQSICFFAEESTVGPRCMYWIEKIDGHCDCMFAQKFSRGESVDLKAFRKAKIRRLILGNPNIWDETKIVEQTKSILERKIRKYSEVDIQILQDRYNNKTLQEINGFGTSLFDKEWEVFYTGGGSLVEGETRDFIEGEIRKDHDIDYMVNLLVKHEEIHDKFRYNKKTDDEMSEIMGEYETHQATSIVAISPHDWKLLDMAGLVEWNKTRGSWLNYGDNNYYVENETTGWYEQVVG